MSRYSLNDRQQAFCFAYVYGDISTRGCGKYSAIKAGYSRRTATSQASRMFTKDHVQRRIFELRDQGVPTLQVNLQVTRRGFTRGSRKVRFSIYGIREMQERFAQAYVMGDASTRANAKRSAIAAGYSPKSAEFQGPKLLTHRKVRGRIRDLYQELESWVSEQTLGIWKKS